MSYTIFLCLEVELLKICDWKRFLTFCAVVLLLLIIALHQCSRKELKVKEVEEYTVQSGETLWSIGTEFKPENMSIQEYIYNLKKYNNIDSTIYPEQVIQVLIYEEA